MKTKKELGSLAKHRAYLGLPPKNGTIVPFRCKAGDVFRKQVKGLAERLKAIGCKSAIIGVSGGLDSTLAVLVVDAAFKKLGLDKNGIHVYTMPGFGTSHRTKNNAGLLCEGLGLNLETIDIRPACRRHFKDIGHDGKTPDVTFENAQARMRTLILMDKANMYGGIVVGTGDMSEIALGWCTYNGDHMSMFAVNSGVPKTIVAKVCGWWARENPGIAADAINDIIATPISPELIAGQVTEDKIGPYLLHDFFLWNFIVNEMGSVDLAKAAKKHFADEYSEELIAKTLDTFMHRIFSQAFKRNCAPDGIRIFDFDMSPSGWHIPSDLGYMKI